MNWHRVSTDGQRNGSEHSLPLMLPKLKGRLGGGGYEAEREECSRVFFIGPRGRKEREKIKERGEGKEKKIALAERKLYRKEMQNFQDTNVLYSWK